MSRINLESGAAPGPGLPRFVAPLRLPALLGLAALLLCSAPVRAQIQGCSATSPTIAFGNVDPVGGSNYSTSSSITVTCSLAFLVTGSANFSICLDIGGAAPGRVMSSGANTLNYNLYQDSAHTTIWGSHYSEPPYPLVVNMTVSSLILGGVTQVTVPIYGYLQSSQNTTAPSGSYLQGFGGSETAVSYNFSYSLFFLPGTPTPCTSGTNNSGGTFAFNSTASVVNDCLVSATTINFGGSVGVLTGPVTANGTITATCTESDNYTIALSQGTTSGASLTDRQMAGSGGAVVHYELYTGSSYATVWGDGTSGTGTASGTGNGSGQNYTVYGRVQAQTTPKPGTYSDTITVTVTY
ncbi:MAG: spore coat protein U domain-containing protein [Nevskia sp.]|nr:spore coat protein U domain-containing protein [Nevskia sp.]